VANLNETWLPPKRAADVIWRASISAHAACRLDESAQLESRKVDVAKFHAADVLRQDEQINWPALRRFGARVLRVDVPTMRRSDGHRVHGANPYVSDCLHYCLPGVPDVWLALLYHALLVG
tara:strand:- start:80 stop:442 length:363 start_codon:yes stop_codon:yes gene_type:complete